MNRYIYFIIFTLILISGCSGPQAKKSEINVSPVVSGVSNTRVYASVAPGADGGFKLEAACFHSDRVASICLGGARDPENNYVDLRTLKPAYDISTRRCNAVGWSPYGRCMSNNGMFKTELDQGRTFGSWLLLIPFLAGNSWHFLVFDQEKYESMINDLVAKYDINSIYNEQITHENKLYHYKISQKEKEAIEVLARENRKNNNMVLAEQLFDRLKNLSKDVGEKVCNRANIFGYIDRISGSRIQVRQIGKVHFNKTLYFFNNETKGGSFKYSKPSVPLVWDLGTKWATCNFDDVY